MEYFGLLLMNNLTIGKNAISEINWENLEIYWANIYEEEYTTNVTSNR